MDFGSARLMTPLGGGALATSGNAFGGWDLTGASEKTLGELWRQTLTASPDALALVLCGDPTLRIAGR